MLMSRTILQRRTAELNGLVELLRTQRRTDGFDLVLHVFGGTQTRQSVVKPWRPTEMGDRAPVECSEGFTIGCTGSQHGN
jgi:hypothetical protein